ncbi:MAG: lipoate--protein ligase family protein [Caldilineae bacterium]|nr:MAG: lipoate--protein ligase family protein [Caldilineae bacterium]
MDVEHSQTVFSPAPAPPAVWRLIITPPASGARNMAVDEAIATLSAQGHSPPTLRFYQWQPGTVSLGRHQSIAEVDRAAIRARGYGLVRRPTGGRAILHIDELTYSIAGPQDEPRLSGAILDSYMRLSEGLVLGLQRLGIAAVKAPGSSRTGPDVSAVCFEVPSAYEICAGGKKLIGSAQSRRAGYVLQHGSLPLYGDITRLVDVLALPTPEERAALKRLVASRATTVAEQLGRRVTFWEAATVLIDGLNSALNVDFEEGELSPEEEALAAELEAEKYANPAWTERV